MGYTNFKINTQTKDIGCNFAAYGFLGIPYGGYVIEDKNGIGMEIFEIRLPQSHWL